MLGEYVEATRARGEPEPRREPLSSVIFGLANRLHGPRDRAVGKLFCCMRKLKQIYSYCIAIGFDNARAFRPWYIALKLLGIAYLAIG